jgi:hypothetical protein
MAVTIVRTNWIDDDGSGTTGTVLNNAVKTDLYNQIDGALAKVAQLAGGNAFTGNQSIAGVLSVAASGSFVAAGASLSVRNTSNAANAAGLLYVGNDADPNLTIIQSFSSTTAASGSFVLPNGSMLYAGGAGGLALAAGAGAGNIRFFSGGSVERMRIQPTGEVLVNTLQAGGKISVGIAGGTGLWLQNVDAGNNAPFQAFVNGSFGLCGGITQTGATSVTFLTTSDARLKDDAGRATDLSALRGIVVHDFTWKVDGIRDRGVFAQDAHALYPRAVVPGTDDTTDDGTLKTPWMTDYSKFVPDLIVGWQQHDTELAALRAELATLKGLN